MTTSGMFVQFSCKETYNGTLEATPAGVVQIGPPLLFILSFYRPTKFSITAAGRPAGQPLQDGGWGMLPSSLHMPASMPTSPGAFGPRMLSTQLAIWYMQRRSNRPGVEHEHCHHKFFPLKNLSMLPIYTLWTKP
jgi:hypothetical protein